MFGRTKDRHRIATRYDHCPIVILSAIALTASMLFWLCNLMSLDHSLVRKVQGLWLWNPQAARLWSKRRRNSAVEDDHTAQAGKHEDILWKKWQTLFLNLLAGSLR
jgi:hypothetical protein